MKKIFFITFFTLTSISTSYAYVYEAKAIKDIISTVQNTKFTYKERGLIFGYNSIQSCLYVSKEIAILKNYCYPARPYIAKSFTIISPKYGMIEFYQEAFAEGVKHDVQITTFPDVLKDYFNISLDNENISSVNVNFEKLENLQSPACWSTSLSYEDGLPKYGCLGGNGDNVADLQKWIDESQTLTGNDKAWNQLFQAIEISIKK